MSSRDVDSILPKIMFMVAPWGHLKLGSSKTWKSGSVTMSSCRRRFTAGTVITIMLLPTSLLVSNMSFKQLCRLIPTVRTNPDQLVSTSCKIVKQVRTCRDHPYKQTAFGQVCGLRLRRVLGVGLCSLARRCAQHSNRSADSITTFCWRISAPRSFLVQGGGIRPLSQKNSSSSILMSSNQ